MEASGSSEHGFTTHGRREIGRAASRSSFVSSVSLPSVLQAVPYYGIRLCSFEAFRAHRGEVRAVIPDVTMPRVGGEEAFRQLRRLDLDVRVLLSSGSTPSSPRGRPETAERAHAPATHPRSRRLSACALSASP
jgi:hypothetical protein